MICVGREAKMFLGELLILVHFGREAPVWWRALLMFVKGGNNMAGSSSDVW